MKIETRDDCWILLYFCGPFLYFLLELHHFCRKPKISIVIQWHSATEACWNLAPKMLSYFCRFVGTGQISNTLGVGTFGKATGMGVDLIPREGSGGNGWKW